VAGGVNFLDTVLRLGGGIALEALALIVWNVGSRSPLQLVRDAAHSLRDPKALGAGLLSLLVGVIFALAATLLMIPTLTDPETELVPVETFTFIVALAIELLVGDDLRRLAAGRRSPQSR